MCSSFQMHAFSVHGGETTSVSTFQIRWKEDDLSLLEMHPLKPAAAATGDSDGDSPNGGGSGPKATSGVDGGNRGDSDGDEGSGGGGLPTGAIAGIVVGVALLVAIVIIAGLLWHRKRHLKQAKSDGQDQGGQKTDAAAGQPINSTGLPPVYSGVPQEMEATQKPAPPGTFQHDLTDTAAEVHEEPRPSHHPPIQQLDGLSVPHRPSNGIPPPTTTPRNAPLASKLYNSTTTIPSELGGGSYSNAGNYPSELHSLQGIPELSSRTVAGYTHTSPSVAEMHAFTVRPTELASGRMADGNWPFELGDFPRQVP